MSERIGVEITARDGASRVFSQVTSGLDKMERSLAQADQASGRFSRSGAAMGAALGAVTGILSNSARAASEAQVSQDRLQASIEATGALYEQYADQLEAAGEAAVQMAFDDEEAADAISFLTQATGDASTAINDLGLVMDIARGRGIGLAEAAKIVAAAEQGRFTALRRIGIQLDENATKEEAIAALQQKYAGQAEAYANSQAGGYDRMLVKLGNLNEALGEHTGELQGVLMLLPGLSAGYTAVAAALGGLLPLLKGVGGAMGGGRLGGAGIAAGGVLGGLGLVGWMLANPEATGISEDLPFFEAFQDQATKLELTIGRLAASGQQYAADTGQQSGQIVTGLTAMAQRHHELLYLIENDQSASSEQTAAWWHELGIINDQLGQRFADNSAYYLSSMTSDVNTVLGYTGEGAGLAQDKLAKLNEEFERGWLSPSEYATQVDILANDLAYYDEQAGRGAKSTAELGEAMGVTSGYAAAHAAGMERQAKLAEDVAKAQEQLAHQFDLTRNAYMGTTEALASGFRVAVQNTSAIAQQSQAVADWATNLIAAQGEYSKLDELVAAGRITGESGQFEGASEYAAAQRAHNSILKDNAAIQEHILTIQAKQAPLVAALVDEQERYLASLADAPAQQQMLALAYMDSATSAQALSLAQGYLQDQDVFGPMIEQAAALDPYLRMILEDMGLIAVDREGNITLTGVDDAKSQLDTLTTAIEALVQAQWIAMFGGDISAAEAAYEQATGLLVDWDNNEGFASLGITDYASGTINAVQMSLDALDGRVVTSYINTVSTFSGDSYSPLGGGARLLGGVAGYADGGMVTIRAAEAGAERFDYPGGGSGMAWTDGLYNVPKGTYVNTAPATAMTGNHGGYTINVTIAGNVYGIEDLEDKVTDALVPALSRAMAINRRGQGG